MSLSWGYLQTTDEQCGKHHSMTRSIADSARVDNTIVEHTLQEINRITFMLAAKITERDVDAQEIKSGIERLTHCEKSMRRSFGMKTENKAHSL